MSQAIPTQHPAVVLRSHYVHLRALLAVATIAIVGLTIAVVVLAATTNGARIATPSVRVSPPTATADSGARLDHRGIADSKSGSLETRARGASCGDVCSSYRRAPAIATQAAPASA